MDGLDSLLLTRMPLAEAVFLFWRHLFDEEHLQTIFERHRGRCYEETISVVTDLLDENVYVGEDLLAMYRERFGIERMFQKVVEVFGLESMIGGTPEATIFQFAFCLLLYNQIQLVRGYVAEQQKIEFETVSLEQLFIDVKRELIAWSVVVPVEVSVSHFEQPETTRRSDRLRYLLQSQWSERWKKSTNKKRRSHPRKKKQLTHHSVYQILKKQKK